MSVSERVALDARALGIAAFVLAVEWARALAERNQPVPVLIVGGMALCLPALGFRAEQLGLSGQALLLRLVGGVAIAAVLLLPTALRGGGGVAASTGFAAAAAIAVSVGEELAFRGALYAALDTAWGPAAAVFGSAAAFTAAHAVSHPLPELLPLAAAGILLGAWRWAFNDLVAPILGHVLTDLAL